MSCYYCNSEEHEDSPCPVRQADAQRFIDKSAKVVHCKKEKYDVYIGRPSKWGNPYSHLPNTLAKYKVATREEAIEKYEKWIRNNPELLVDLPELEFKVLGCWCKPNYSCHGDVLVKLLKERNNKNAISN